MTSPVGSGACAACLALLVAVGLSGCGSRSAAPALDADVFLNEDTGAPAEAEVRAVLASYERRCEGTVPDSGTVPSLRVDYPLDGSVFPPEIVAPTFLFRDPDNATGSSAVATPSHPGTPAVPGAKAERFLVRVSFEGTPHRLYVLTSGRRQPGDPDPRCAHDDSLTVEDAPFVSPTGWTPTEKLWSLMKRHSTERDATVEVLGMSGGSAVSRGAVRIRTSKDPVGAPIFYRDVPLMPAETKDGVIKPLKEEAIVLIKWRLRDLSKGEAPAVLEHLPTCGNCHSFSTDGRTLSMDIDGPDGDKGAHVVKTLARRTVIESSDVFTWNSFKEGRPDAVSFGLFPRVSPDGRFVVATVHESLYVQNYADYRFLQTFYPTRGVLAVFERATRTIRRLPGADDPAFVQTNAVWSPDGKTLVFLRAEAKDAYRPGEAAKFANDPRETSIRYDLYRIPFNDGRGGTAEPIEGASNSGASNSFPKFSPDGKWLVFVQAKNGLLMRPDGKLCIMPAAGGAPRVMRCNTPRMNSWHSWSPNGRWLVFSSKWLTPYTQMFLTHVDEDGNDTFPVLVPNSTAPNRAVNLPEFASIPPGGLEEITTPAVDYRRHTLKANELIKAGRLDEALAELRTSLALKGDYPETLAAFGAVLSEQGQHEEAMSYFRRALEIEPYYYPAHVNAGIALGRQGRYDEAMCSYETALRIFPKCVEAHYNWGNALMRTRRAEEALEHFRRAVAIKPDYADAWNNIGGILSQQGRPDEAVDCFRRAIEADPKYASAYFNWGLVLERKGELDGAAERFRRTLDANPRHAGARQHLDAIESRRPPRAP